MLLYCARVQALHVLLLKVEEYTCCKLPTFFYNVPSGSFDYFFADPSFQFASELQPVHNTSNSCENEKRIENALKSFCELKPYKAEQKSFYHLNLLKLVAIFLFPSVKCQNIIYTEICRKLRHRCKLSNQQYHHCPP